MLEDKDESKKEEEINIIVADEICNDFRKYIKIFIESICKNNDEFIGGDYSKNQAARRGDKVSSMISNVKKEERDLNINKFITKFIENGKAKIMKEKLQKFIIKIAYKKRKEVNEKFEEQKENFLVKYMPTFAKKSNQEWMNIFTSKEMKSMNIF